ncbi:MAG TPA: twin-arginine translocase TatA/TatE family subunit [Dehalococcoidia bacterium]|nr:twin-arginine translocase TatA/TatE family subunit [Dehalococcoidia bacterium]
MQFIGIGIPELLVILTLTVIVVGPERLPEVAAQLARWIRQAQAYANHVRKDFSEVMSELERETGASREDLKAIGEVLRRDTRSVFEEIDKAGREVREAADVEKAAGGNVIPFTGAAAANGQGREIDSTALQEAAMSAEAAAPEGEPDARASEPPSDEEWFKPAPSRRRRAGSDAT